jgi:hypothetical protein
MINPESAGVTRTRSLWSVFLIQSKGEDPALLKSVMIMT